jgi:hypothetical protein
MGKMGWRGFSLVDSARIRYAPHGPTSLPPNLPSAPQRQAYPAPRSGHEGCSTEAEIMVELVSAGLATATAQRVKAGRERLEVATLRIPRRG